MGRGWKPDALLRSCSTGHLTGSALVVDDDRERTLVMLHVKLGLWLQPGGHADGEGHLATVAWTEATEETGIDGLRLLGPPVDCDIHHIPERPGEPAHLHLDTRYVVLAPPDADAVGNHESHALRWVTLDQLDDLAGDESLQRLARVGLAAAGRAAPAGQAGSGGVSGGLAQAQAVPVGVHHDGVTGLVAAREERLGQRRLEQGLDRAA